jgi:trehalose 6-phosphate phosphatase
MNYIFRPEHREILRRFCASDLLVAFEFDGTLAPITESRHEAKMRAVTAALLADTARRYPCMVISGRTRGDVRRRLGNAPLVEVFGNHGAEPWEGSERARSSVRRWCEALAFATRELNGVEIEDKSYSLAIHYRRALAETFTRSAILGACRRIVGARIIEGKRVVNVVPSAAPNKGTVLVRERERLGCRRALYVGDDCTDKDVFDLGEPERLLSVRVGEPQSSCAGYFIENQLEIDALLGALVELREVSSTGESCRGGGALRCSSRSRGSRDGSRID